MERKNSTKEKMAQILSCRICLERLVSPKTLTCDHTYCQTCLEDLFVAGENKLICPVCRKDQCNVTKVEAIKDLPTNLYVKQSLEVLYGEGVFTEKRARRLLEQQETGDGSSKNNDDIGQTKVDLSDSKEYNKQHKSKVSREEDSKEARKLDGTTDIVKGIQNLSVAEDEIGMSRSLFSVTSEKGEFSCSDVESDNDDAFYFNSENETTVSLKKKGKSQRFLKYLNKKLYGSGDYGDFFNRPADTNVKCFSTRDKSINPASEKNPKVKVNQNSYKLAVTGSGFGILATRKSFNFKKYKGVQGLGYMKKYGNDKSTNSAGSKTPSRKKEDIQNKGLKKNVFASRSKVSKRHCLGRGRGVLIYLK